MPEAIDDALDGTTTPSPEPVSDAHDGETGSGAGASLGAPSLGSSYVETSVLGLYQKGWPWSSANCCHSAPPPPPPPPPEVYVYVVCGVSGAAACWCGGVVVCVCWRVLACAGVSLVLCAGVC